MEVERVFSIILAIKFEAQQSGFKFATTMWPRGQAVKTAASHAVNVGSIPAGVTKLILDKRRKL